MKTIDPIDLKLTKTNSIAGTNAVYISTLHDMIQQIMNSSNDSDHNSKDINDIKLNKLPAYSVQSIMKNRKGDSVVGITGLLPFDIDFKHEKAMTEEEILLLTEQVFVELKEWDNLKPIVLHRTISKKGLHVIYYIPELTLENYLPVAGRIADLIDKTFNIKIDRACISLSRYWCANYDPDAHIDLAIHKRSKIIDEILKEPDQDSEIHNDISNNPVSTNGTEIYLKQMKDYLENNCYDGNKHIALRDAANISGSFIRRGIVTLDFATEYLANYITNKPNVKNLNAAIRTIQKGIERGIKTYDQEVFDKMLLNTSSEYIDEPDLFESVKDYLPNTMVETISQYDLLHIRDFLFMAIVTIVSSLIPRVSFTYNGSKKYCNFYSLIISPPATGKSEINPSLRLLKPIEEILKKEKRIHNIGANFSTAMLLETLANNKGVGIIIDTEADTYSAKRENDWGNDSAQLRKFYANEKEIYLRKQNDKPIIIEKPIVSLLLTGTRDQLERMFDDFDNGLFSRFFVLLYNPKSEFKLKDPDFKFDYSYLDDLGTKLGKFYSTNPDQKEFSLQFTKEQFTKIEEIFSKYKESIESQKFQDPGIVFRSALGLCKLASTIHIIYEIDNLLQNEKDHLTISDKAFNTAFLMIAKFIRTSMTIAINQAENNQNKAKPIKNKFLIDLIDRSDGQFTRKEIVEKVSGQVSPRTLDRFLKQSVESKKLVKTKSGTYIKV